MRRREHRGQHAPGIRGRVAAWMHRAAAWTHRAAAGTYRVAARMHGVAAVRGAGRGQQRTCTRRHGRRGAARAAVRRSARGPSATAPRRLACSMGVGDAVRVGHVYMCARVHRVCVRACARARACACAWCMGAACFDGDAEGREARGAHHVELLVRERHPVRSAAPGLGLGLGLANPYPTLT